MSPAVTEPYSLVTIGAKSNFPTTHVPVVCHAKPVALTLERIVVGSGTIQTHY